MKNGSDGKQWELGRTGGNFRNGQLENPFDFWLNRLNTYSSFGQLLEERLWCLSYSPEGVLWSEVVSSLACALLSWHHSCSEKGSCYAGEDDF
jgi:hypothetical protein